VRVVALAALLALALPLDGAVAQFAPGARAVGMGGGGMVFATGVDAVELNPANLGWRNGWSFSLYEFGVATLGTGATFADLVTVLGGDWPFSGSDLAVPQIIDGLPDEGVGASFVTEGFATQQGIDQIGESVPGVGSPIPSIGFTYGRFGLRLRSRVMFDTALSKELADLIGNGFVEERIQEYVVRNTGFRAMSASEVTASFGTMVGEVLSVGVGARYVRGHKLADGRFFEPVLDLVSSPQTLSVSSVVVESTGGKGFGIDVGFSLELPVLGLRVSASGTNVFQRMTWEDELIAHSATFTDSTLDAEEFVDLLDLYRAQTVDPASVSLPVYVAARELFEESYFPAIFRGGVGMQRGGTSVELVGISVAPRGRYTSAWDERISLGLEQRIPVLTLRAGLALAQDGLRAYTGGVGLRAGSLHFDAGLGVFDGKDGATPYDGGYVTIALQLMGGGA
jgi:hypothetical protein